MKTKTSLWLGVCTLVLCLGVMTFGVYSAISANLNMSGTLGFNMHNCMVTVQGTVYNLAEIPQGQNYANRIDRPIERTIMGGENTTTASISLGDMYFFQHDNSNVYDIIIELSFINVSSTAIKATIPAPTVGNGVTLVTDSASGYTTLPVSDAIIEQNATYTVKFALHLNSLDALANNVNFSWNNITFEEYVKPLQGNNIKYNLTASNATVDVTSTKVGYSTGGTSYQTTRQNILMDTDNTIRVTNSDGKGTTAEVNVGTLNFSNTNPIQPIVLTLTATNKSSTQVASMIAIDEIHDATYTLQYYLGTNLDAAKTAYKEAVILNANASITFTITLTSTNPKEPSTNNLKISANFTKYTTIQSPYTDTTQGLTYTLNAARTAWSVMGGDGDDEYFNSKLKVRDVIIADEIFGLPVTTIPDYAFGAEISGSDISTIYIPNTITSIGYSAFRHCASLTSINIPDSVTSIGNRAFSDCGNLTSVSLGNSVTSIGNYAFNWCPSLTSVSLGNSVTSIGVEAFYGCYKLVEVINKSKLTLIIGSTNNGYVALYAKQIMSDESQSKLKTDANGCLIYDGTILVDYTGTQTEITIPIGITEINQYAFSGCSSLTSVNIPDSVTSIGDRAFNNCRSLTSVTIGKRVAIIGDYAFSDCGNLTSVSLGNSVTSIGYRAFYSCTSLESVTFDGATPPTFGGDVFYDCSANLTIHVPAGSVSNYQSKVTPSSVSGKVV